MATERQMPGGPYINETDSAQRQVPGGAFLSGTAATAAATSYSIAGPASGLSGSPSDTFTSIANGSTTAMVTVSDNGSGGSFSPSATFAANGGTFTYTPSSPGSKILSFTNNGGLTNQTNITFNAFSVPTGTITSQPAPSGQSQRFVGITSNSASGTYTLTSTDGGMNIGPLPYTINSDSFDFTVQAIPSGAYLPTLTVTGDGGTRNVSGTMAFSIAGVGGGGVVAPGGTPVTPIVTGVDISPSVVTLAGGATQQFVAAVQGLNSPSQAVTYATTAGSISSSGLFTAPAATSSQQTITITATSVADPSKSATATALVAAVIAPTAPSAPLNVVAIAGVSLVTLTFDPPLSGGTSPISGYRITSSDGTVFSVPSSPATVSAAPGVPVFYTVRAINDVGAGLPSLPSNTVVPTAPELPPTFPPGAPMNITAVAVVRGILVNATPPGYTGSSDITGYVITASTGQSVQVDSLPATIAMPALISASVRVQAVNDAGVGLMSAKSSTVTPMLGEGEGKNYSTDPAPRKRVIRL